MIARLACHVVPNHGVLFIALPVRGVQAVGEEMFIKFLAIFQLRPLIPPKKTPKIVFYALRSEMKTVSSSSAEPWKEVVRAAMRRADPSVAQYFGETAAAPGSFSLQLPLVK